MVKLTIGLTVGRILKPNKITNGGLLMWICIYQFLADMRDDLVDAMSAVGAELAHVVVIDRDKMEVYVHVPDFDDGMKFLKWTEQKLIGAAFEQKMEAFPVLRNLTNPVKTFAPSGDQSA